MLLTPPLQTLKGFTFLLSTVVKMCIIPYGFLPPRSCNTLNTRSCDMVTRRFEGSAVMLLLACFSSVVVRADGPSLNENSVAGMAKAMARQKTRSWPITGR